jgi:antitoxin (DNA-binding transcriptional repressor) of toxin-antitoxin stability system
MEKRITVTEAARNFADCVNRAHYQNVTFVLLKSGIPMARIVPHGDKTSTGRDIAAAIAGVKLSAEERRAWRRDLESARKALKPVTNKWR